MTEQVGGTLVEERPPSLITQLLGPTTGLTWERCELPIEAASCPVTWCQGIHSDEFETWINHERDIALATRNGKPILEIAVHRVMPTRAGSVQDTGDSFAIRTAKRPEIFVLTYDDTPTPYRAMYFEGGLGHGYAESFTTILRMLGQYEFAGAMADAIDLCRKIEGADQ